MTENYNAFAERWDRRVVTMLVVVALPVLAVAAFCDLISRPFRERRALTDADRAWLQQW